MSKYIKDSTITDINLVGSKTSNLIELSKLDINVPTFICISTTFFDDLLIENKIDLENILLSIDLDDDNSINKSCKLIKKLIQKIKINDDFNKELNEYLEVNFKHVESFSIRSSSSIEDNNDYSFAGLFDTYLNTNKKDIKTYILKCFSSLYTPNVLKYAYLHHIDLKCLKMSVIVQEMVMADSSGVIFTSNPQGLLNETVIINGNSLGNKVVEDKIDVTTYYYNKTDRTYYYEVKGKSKILSNHIIDKLMDISSNIQKHLGAYLDIEYAIKTDRIYILQTRPITTINDDHLVILDNSNIVESYPHITLPLTYSFIEEAYAGVFKNIISIIVGDKKIIRKLDYIFKEMIGTVNGRVYYKISNWYTLIKYLPFNKKIVPIWQDMMGVKDKKVSDKNVHLPFINLIKIYFNFVINFILVPRKMKKLEKDFNYINEYFYANFNNHLNNYELQDLYDQLGDKILSKWGVTLLNDVYAFVFTGLIKSKLKRYGLKNYEEATNKYISGISNIESMKPIRELIRISNLVITENKLDELKRLKDNIDVAEYLTKDGEINNEIKEYINAFGDRYLEELKLESPTFRSSPILLINKIIEYTSDLTKLKKITQSFDTNINNDWIYEIDGFNILQKWLLKCLSKRALLGIKNRETSRLNRSRIYGMIRAIFLTIGNNLYEDNLIESVEDIFYLTKDEIFKFIDGKKLDLKEIVKHRKAEFKAYRKLPSYSRLVFMNEEWSKHPSNIKIDDTDENINQMIGTPCSNGKVTGEVIVVNNSNDVKNVRDKILVTKMTDPGWVFLLTVAKGIITEKGSLLSHTAIISRELKIPSIVGVSNITKILHNGDIIVMDGNSGLIEKVSKKDD
jgi:pyruvate,water dikinase